MPQYLIIKFIEEGGDGVSDIISSTWLEGRTKCKYPSSNAEMKMLNHEGPRENDGCTWETCPIRIIASRGGFC